jgi:hypothetical protein
LINRQAVKDRIDGHEEREGTQPAKGCHQPEHCFERDEAPGAGSFGSRDSKDVCHVKIQFLSGRLESMYRLLQAREEKRGKKPD